jgi:hypothetical protein
MIEQTGERVFFILGFAGGVVSFAFISEIIKTTKAKAPIRKQVKPILLFNFSVTLLAFLYAVAQSGGLLEDWIPIGKPMSPDIPVEVINVGVIKTESGDLYRYLGYSQWEKTNSSDIQEILSEEIRFIPKPGNCATISFLPLDNYYFNDMKSFCIAWGVGISKVAYAIDYRGEIYHWGNYIGEFGWFETVFYPIYSVILCLIFGFIFTGLIRLIFLIKSRSGNANQ